MFSSRTLRCHPQPSDFDAQRHAICTKHSPCALPRRRLAPSGVPSESVFEVPISKTHLEKGGRRILGATQEPCVLAPGPSQGEITLSGCHFVERGCLPGKGEVMKAPGPSVLRGPTGPHAAVYFPPWQSISCPVASSEEEARRARCCCSSSWWYS